ncbi:MAG: CpsD/CapB family tyrosine-protein kinase [Planctomycetales bacterium]|nr:CpsD/CapB family tyrosine-protein kinase [Planctomycetales bacterium]MCA9169166.1 CpsD/CapB family tyrosine-protein kinase [Planctomycetales bacterium]
MSTTPLDKSTPLRNSVAAEHSVTRQPATTAAASAKNRARATDQFVALASRILSLRGDATEAKSLGVTSCTASEGTSTVATQLSIALAAAGTGRVLLVELPNLIAPGRVARRKAEAGWAELILGDVDVEDVTRATQAQGVWRMAAGDVKQLGTLGVDAHRLSTMIRELKEHFEFVVFDLPEANELTGCLPLASVLDGVILVVQQGRVSSDKALRAKLELEQANAQLIGVVLNKTRSYAPRLLYRLLPFLKPR